MGASAPRTCGPAPRALSGLVFLAALRKTWADRLRRSYPPTAPRRPFGAVPQAFGLPSLIRGLTSVVGFGARFVLAPARGCAPGLRPSPSIGADVVGGTWRRPGLREPPTAATPRQPGAGAPGAGAPVTTLASPEGATPGAGGWNPPIHDRPGARCQMPPATGHRPPATRPGSYTPCVFVLGVGIGRRGWRGVVYKGGGALGWWAPWMRFQGRWGRH